DRFAGADAAWSVPSVGCGVAAVPSLEGLGPVGSGAAPTPPPGAGEGWAASGAEHGDAGRVAVEERPARPVVPRRRRCRSWARAAGCEAKGSYGRLAIKGVGHISVKLHRNMGDAVPTKLVVRR